MSDLPNKTLAIEKAAVPIGAQTVIAGYTLQSQLGVGGYGEVWKAIGPGGLPKAIKILFGKTDGKHADAELKSLQRMRELRHPFLLNIERIESFEGRLIVVSELADCCLQDRFDVCRRETGRGIPRDELLQYLRDAADALDFMLEEQGLQHLDIKPENLMLQGKHVKVGDYGMTKDLNNTHQSLVGGFTPLYAPPELFEGRPSTTSDQYSLAIVYQTMLTGEPPFSGRTPAQLTAQHLNSSPDLSALQPIDRPVIARALSKNPTARFNSCRAFVDELTKRRNSRVQAKIKSGTTRMPTQLVNTAAAAAAAGQMEVVRSTPLPPTEVPNNIAFQPTLFIGIGGIGGNVLRLLREQFHGQFGERNLTAFPMLYLDSDRQAITNQMQDDAGRGLTETELVPLALRSAKDYREDEDLDLEWLSRRWIFNIPRTGNVDGMRPLGRLAYVDHEKTIRRRIQEALTAAIDPQAVAASSVAMSLPLTANQPEIVIVGSVSGGTASGMLQDVGCLVRDVCQEMNIEPYRISGVLTHGTGSQRQLGDIQEANTLASLAEFKHAYTPGLSNQTPFDTTTILHMGDGLTPAEFARGVQQTADYIFMSAATPARPAMEHWKNIEEIEENVTGNIRVLGIASADASVYEMVKGEARNICHAILSKWRFVPLANPDYGLIRLTLGELVLTQDALSKRVMEVLRGKTGAAIEDWSSSMWTDMTDAASDQSAEQRLEQIKTAFTDGRDPRVAAIMTSAYQAVPETPEVAAIKLREQIFCLLSEEGRLNGAAANLHDASSRLEKASEWLHEFLGEVDKNIIRLQVEAKSVADDEAIQSLCKQYSAVLFYQAIYRHFGGYVDSVLASIKQMSPEFDALRDSLAKMCDAVASSEAVDYPPQLIEAFDVHIMSADNFHLIDLINDDVDNEQCFHHLLNDAQDFLLANAGEDSAGGKDFPNAAVSKFNNIGGGVRVLAGIPKVADTDEWRKKIEVKFGDCVHTQVRPGKQVVAISHVEGIQFVNLIEWFASRNPRLLEFASRVRTRTDVSI